MTLEGVSGETKRVGKYGEEVRVDGWGTMSDEEVTEYKRVRKGRYVADRMDAVEHRLDVLEGVEESLE